MRSGFLAVLGVAVLFGAAYWPIQLDIACDTPITYRIGELDQRFNLSQEEALDILRQAEAVWEVPLSTELFLYDAEGDIPVHFIFDDRQEQSNAEAELREDLEAKEGMSDTVAEQYDALITEFRSLETRYESRVGAYEEDLQKYNDEVSAWNDKGGAPEDVRVELAERADGLKAEQDELQTFAKRLNELIAELNRIGARGNGLIADYNSIVEQYNNRFAHTDEFAQGDYTGDAIHIYEFNNQKELTIVLAHEFGHALSIGHVEGESSIMYPQMGAQSALEGLTPEDRAAYTESCSNRTLLTHLIRYLRTFFR